MDFGIVRKCEGRAPRFLVAPAALAFAACYSVPTATTPVPNTQVQVNFAEPVTIAAVGQPGDSLWLRDIMSIRGRVTKLTSDSVYLRVTGAGGRTGSIRDIPAGREAAIPRRADMTVQRDDRGTAQAAGMLVLLGLVGLVIAAIMLADGMPES